MDLEVVGRHALLFDDDATAAFTNSSDALVEWNGLSIDRYDVRHLLPSPPPPRKPRRQYTEDASLGSEIDHERYLDLPPPGDDEQELGISSSSSSQVLINYSCLKLEELPLLIFFWIVGSFPSVCCENRLSRKEARFCENVIFCSFQIAFHVQVRFPFECFGIERMEEVEGNRIVGYCDSRHCFVFRRGGGGNLGSALSSLYMLQ